MVEILLTNDDGIGSAGILALADSLTRLGRVTVVAPDRERSATSQALTLSRPIRYQELSTGKYSVDGTPTDCVIFALHYLLKFKPDLVVSGINHGPNLGRDIGYSGTVAGAIEGSNHDIPAFAISLAGGADDGFRTAVARLPLALAPAFEIRVRVGRTEAHRGLVDGLLEPGRQHALGHGLALARDDQRGQVAPGGHLVLGHPGSLTITGA